MAIAYRKVAATSISGPRVRRVSTTTAARYRDMLEISQHT